MLDPEFGKEKHEEMDTSNSPQGSMSEAINEDGDNQVQSLATADNKDEQAMNADEKETADNKQPEADLSDPEGTLYAESIPMNNADKEGDDDMDSTALAQDDKAENELDPDE